MNVPEFVKIEQDLENRRLALTVANSDITEQKEMWGMFDAMSLCRCTDTNGNN